MGKIVFLVVCLGVLINKGSALKCYNCKSDTINGCIEGAPGNERLSCGLEHPQILHFCLHKIVYDKELKKDTYVSSCEALVKPRGRDNNKDIPVPESIIVLDRNVQQCQPNQTHEIKQCEVCRTDLCNYFVSSAPVSKMNLFMLLCLPVLYFFTKFLAY